LTRPEVHPHHVTSAASQLTQQARPTSDDAPQTESRYSARGLPAFIVPRMEGYEIQEVAIGVGEKSANLIRVFITIELETLEVSTWTPTAIKKLRALDGRSRDAVADILAKNLDAYRLVVPSVLLKKGKYPNYDAEKGCERPYFIKVADGNTSADEVPVGPNVPTTDSTLGPFSLLVIAGIQRAPPEYEGGYYATLHGALASDDTADRIMDLHNAHNNQLFFTAHPTLTGDGRFTDVVGRDELLLVFANVSNHATGVGGNGQRIPVPERGLLRWVTVAQPLLKTANPNDGVIARAVMFAVETMSPDPARFVSRVRSTIATPVPPARKVARPEAMHPVFARAMACAARDYAHEPSNAQRAAPPLFFPLRTVLASDGTVTYERDVLEKLTAEAHTSDGPGVLPVCYIMWTRDPESNAPPAKYLFTDELVANDQVEWLCFVLLKMRGTSATKSKSKPQPADPEGQLVCAVPLRCDEWLQAQKKEVHAEPHGALLLRMLLMEAK
jgi:hypothetical protein